MNHCCLITRTYTHTHTYIYMCIYIYIYIYIYITFNKLICYYNTFFASYHLRYLLLYIIYSLMDPFTHVVYNTYTYAKTIQIQKQGVSSWCNGYSDGLRNRSTRVRSPVVLLCSLSGKYPWERYEPLYPPSYGLNSTVLLREWLWH